MKTPEFITTLGVIFNESFLLIAICVVLMIVVISWMWKKIKKVSHKVIALVMVLPMSTGIGAFDTASNLYEEYCPHVKCQDKGKDLSELYKDKKNELFSK